MLEISFLVCNCEVLSFLSCIRLSQQNLHSNQLFFADTEPFYPSQKAFVKSSTISRYVARGSSFKFRFF